MQKKIYLFFLRTVRKMRFLPSETYVKFHYEYFSGKKLDLDNPQDFNAKIEWYKVFYRPEILTQLADKYMVRPYVEEKIGPEYLNKLYKVYSNPKDIEFEHLPNKFVIKANHTNGHNIIVKDKTTLDKKKTIQQLNKWLKKNQYYRRGQEWAYKDIKPKIIIEKYLQQDHHESLIDYKFYCFDGVPKFIDVHLDRESNHQQGCFDLEFNPLPFSKSSSYKNINSELKKPSNLKEMIKISTKLAENLPFVRVDLYSIKGKTIFGELTFYPSDARKQFYPMEYNDIIGSYFRLPELKKGQKKITKMTEIK